MTPKKAKSRKSYIDIYNQAIYLTEHRYRKTINEIKSFFNLRFTEFLNRKQSSSVCKNNRF